MGDFGGSLLLFFSPFPSLACLLHWCTTKQPTPLLWFYPRLARCRFILQFLNYTFILPPWRQKPRVSSGSAAGECVYLGGFEVQPNGKRCYLAASEASAGRGHGRASLRLA